ncbi:MAG: hypothetical protein ACFFD1_12595, partial [Candidatus Thorarchaeota archaeon]
PQYMNIRVKNKNYYEIHQMPLEKLFKFSKELKLLVKDTLFLDSCYNKILNRLEFLNKVGLQYITMNRVFSTLSAGEAQRTKLSALLGSSISGLTISLDEPTRGMHPSEVNSLITVMKELRDRGHTLLVIEHDLDIIKAGDFLVEIGPESGIHGGEITYEGDYNNFLDSKTHTAKWLSNKRQLIKTTSTTERYGWLKLIGATENNLKGDLLEIPLGNMVGICGVSGSGKSTLIIDTLGRIIAPQKHTTSVAYEPIEPGRYQSIVGVPKNVIIIDQVKKGISSPYRYFELEKRFISLYSESDDLVRLELEPEVLKTKCLSCKGKGTIKTDMGFLPSIFSECDACQGSGHIPEAWDIRLNGYSLPELFSLTLVEIYELFKEDEYIKSKLRLILDVGLGYLNLNQPSFSLSGGEVQRLKIAKELSKKIPRETLFLLDEPSLGLHMDDISQLMKVLRMIVAKKNTVIIIEHHPFILASCDWLIELGPTGGENGGHIIAKGPPKKFFDLETPTAPYIKEVLQ